MATTPSASTSATVRNITTSPNNVDSRPGTWAGVVVSARFARAAPSRKIDEPGAGRTQARAGRERPAGAGRDGRGGDGDRVQGARKVSVPWP